jgi:exonuclease SbcD
MRILHTGDWHAGRSLRGRDRLPELEAVLDNLAAFVEQEKVDLLLISGDLFETGAPVASAERAVFWFLKRVGMAGAQSIVIAGNHDNPARLEAWGTLAELVNVHVVPRPCRAETGGILEMTSSAAEKAVVAAVPFAPVRGLVSALQLAESETGAKQHYTDGMRALIQHLALNFRADAVNLLVAHVYIEGAVLAGSEREVHIGDEWAATPQALPPTAHYAALGHIHKPQQVRAAPAPTYYSGSALQLDFGEAGEEKSFVLVEAQPGRPARIERIPYKGGIPLLRVRAPLGDLDHLSDDLRVAGWLEVTVPVAEPDPDLNNKVRRLLPNAVRVLIELPKMEEPQAPAIRRGGLPPRELYKMFYAQRYGSDPDPLLLNSFDELRGLAAKELEM